MRKALQEIPRRKKDSYVFSNKNGDPYRDVRTIFETVLKKSGIMGFRFHDLRHTFASHLVMLGVDLKTVQELMGHKTIEMTLRYAHLSPAHKRSAVESLGSQMDTFWTPGHSEGEEEKSEN